MDIPALPYCRTRLATETPYPGVPADPQTIGLQVRKRRLQRRLLQRELGALLEVTVFTVRNWERGRSQPGPRERQRVAAWLTETEGG
jgi:hypothetical protein